MKKVTLLLAVVLICISMVTGCDTPEQTDVSKGSSIETSIHTSIIFSEVLLPSESKIENTIDSPVSESDFVDESSTLTDCIFDESLPSTSSGTYYQVTEEEREMLARLVFLESSICSSECQNAVVSVVFNRLDSGKWTKDMNNDGKITLYDIVYYPDAFTPAHLISTTKADDESYQAVDTVVENGPTIPTEVRYFRTSYDFNWDNYANYCVMDNVYFGYFTNWKQGAW